MARTIQTAARTPITVRVILRVFLLLMAGGAGSVGRLNPVAAAVAALFSLAVCRESLLSCLSVFLCMLALR